jgi:hypothetical protein
METAEVSSIDRSQIDQRPPRQDQLPARQRSRVTNGRSPFVEVDGRGPWARRWSDVLGEIISDVGGHNAGLSEGQRQLARRAATIAIACEKMEGRAAVGEDIDLEQYGRLTDRLGRAFQRLGLQRQARKLGQSDDELGGAMLADIAERRREQEAAEAIAKAAAADEVVP